MTAPVGESRSEGQAAASIDSAMRATLRVLADVLSPAADDMPAPSAVEVEGELLDRALGARPDLAPPLIQILKAAAGRDPRLELQRLRAEEPAAFLALATAVAGAYYLHPRVMKLVGYPGPAPTADEDPDEPLDESLLAPVIARGPIYRPTPDARDQ